MSDWKKRALNLSEWKRWDRMMRRKAGFFGGLRFWSKTNVPKSRVLLSRHWPHRLCWSWCIWVKILRPGYDGARRFSFAYLRSAKQVRIRLWCFDIDYSWQDWDWMIAPGVSDSAVQIEWRQATQ